MNRQRMAKMRDESFLSRRRMVQGLGAAGAALVTGGAASTAETGLRVAGKEVEIAITSVSAHTFRLTVAPLVDGKPGEIPDDGTLLQTAFGAPAAKFRGAARAQTVKLGDLRIQFTADPLAFAIATSKGEKIQTVRIDPQTGVVSFASGSSPILGLGEGGPQFDRRGNPERMASGSGGYNLRTFGSRVPVPWLIGTGGWAMYIHQPFGRFDFTGDESRFQPAPAFLPGGGRGAPPPQPPADISTFSSSGLRASPPSSWPSGRGLPAAPSFPRFGRSATSSRTAHSPAATRFCRRLKLSAKRNCLAMP